MTWSPFPQTQCLASNPSPCPGVSLVWVLPVVWRSSPSAGCGGATARLDLPSMTPRRRPPRRRWRTTARRPRRRTTRPQKHRPRHRQLRSSLKTRHRNARLWWPGGWFLHIWDWSWIKNKDKRNGSFGRGSRRPKENENDLYWRMIPKGGIDQNLNMVLADGCYEVGSQPLEMENEEMTFCEFDSWIKTYPLHASEVAYMALKTSCVRPMPNFMSAWSWASTFQSFCASWVLSCKFTGQQLCRYLCYVSMVELNQIWVGCTKLESEEKGLRSWDAGFGGSSKVAFLICPRMNMRCSVEFGKFRPEC